VTQPRGAGSGTGAAASSGEGDAVVDQLWLEVLGRVAARSAHEIKGALNGVSVNLEVVRSRAERPDTQASAVLRYAESASEQLESLVRLSEAMLSVARPVRGQSDVVVLLRRFTALLAPATAAEGGSLELVSVPEMPGAGSSPTLTSAPANAVRIALGAALLEAIEPKGRVACSVDAAEVVQVVIEGSEGPSLELPQGIVDVLAVAGIGVTAQSRVISLMFPRESRGASNTDRA
jgi:signal transduction histidine kinase